MTYILKIRLQSCHYARERPLANASKLVFVRDEDRQSTVGPQRNRQEVRKKSESSWWSWFWCLDEALLQMLQTEELTVFVLLTGSL